VPVHQPAQRRRGGVRWRRGAVEREGGGRGESTLPLRGGHGGESVERRRGGAAAAVSCCKPSGLARQWEETPS
jgi:hypothetical protein